MQPYPMSPDDTEDHHEEQQQKGPACTATPPPLPPPRDIYATVASTLAQPMYSKQYHQQVLQELSATHLTIQGWTQGGDSESGPKDDFLWEDTYGTLDAFLGSRSLKLSQPARRHPARPPRPPCFPQQEASPCHHPASPGQQPTVVDS